MLEFVKARLAGGFLRATAVLVGGSAIAQGIMMLSLPIATRLYQPADFSVLALFTAIVSIVSVMACLRFDIAVPIPADDREAANVLALALVFATLIAALCALPALIAPQATAQLLGRPDAARDLWLVPVAVFLAASYSALQFWAVRRKAFGTIAVTRVAQSGAAAGTQIAFGLWAAGPLGLILAMALNVGAGALGLFGKFLSTERTLLATVTAAGMRSAFTAYVRFPKFSTAEAAFNSASIFLPVILIAAYAPAAEAGFVILAMQVMQAPMALIGTAVAQVYVASAPLEHREGRLGPFTVRILGSLMQTGVGPLVFAGIVAAPAFAIIFRPEWRESGELVAWMTPWFVMQFLASPVSLSLHVTGHLRAAMALQAAGLVLRVGAVVVGIGFWPNHLAELYAASGFVFYAAYLVIVLRAVGTDGAALVREAKRAWPIVAAWIVAGVIVRILAEFFLSA